jgi:hypothetical protein
MSTPDDYGKWLGERWAPGDEQLKETLTNIFYNMDREWYEEQNAWLRNRGEPTITFAEYKKYPDIYYLEMRGRVPRFDYSWCEFGEFPLVRVERSVDFIWKEWKENRNRAR